MSEHAAIQPGKGSKSPKPGSGGVSPLSGEVSLNDIIRLPAKVLRPLPLGTRNDVFVEGGSHILAGTWKGGKSTLMAYLCHAWAESGHKVLYLSEEFELVWKLRTQTFRLEPGGFHFQVVYALGEPVERLLQRVRQAREDIVVVDTIRTLLGVRSLANSDEVTMAIKPWLTGTVGRSKSLVLLHHFNKDGDTFAGGGGLLAAVDSLVKYREVDGDTSLRILSTQSRMPAMHGTRFGLRMAATELGIAFLIEDVPGGAAMGRDEQVLYGVIHSEAECQNAVEQIKFLEEEAPLGGAGSPEEVAGKLARLKDIVPRTVQDLQGASGWTEAKTKYVLKQLLAANLVRDVTGNAGVGGARAGCRIRPGGGPGMTKSVPTPAALYGTSTTSPRSRRTQTQIAALKVALVQIVEAEQPMTVRGVFYSAETGGLIAKTEADYKNVICRLVLMLRREGRIDYRWITDGTRWQIKPRSFDGPDDFRAEMVDFYRRALWHDQDTYVEVFCEKDAIAGILSPITGRWDVPLNVVRGFSSETFLWQVAQDIIAIGKPTYLYYFGDWDPSGVVGAKDVERRLRGFAPQSEIYFQRVAVMPEQIQKWRLPTRPTKTSTHSSAFKGDSVEVDAIKAPRLRALVTACIEHHIDPDRLRRTEAVEKVERESLATVLQFWKTPP